MCGAWPQGSFITVIAWCRHTLKNARSFLSLPRTTTIGSPATVVVTYWPGFSPCSSRAANCHVREKTFSRSSSEIRASVYHGAGIVYASASGALALYEARISCTDSWTGRSLRFTPSFEKTLSDSDRAAQHLQELRDPHLILFRFRGMRKETRIEFFG